jgi:hypothetical protein
MSLVTRGWPPCMPPGCHMGVGLWGGRFYSPSDAFDGALDPLGVSVCVAGFLTNKENKQLKQALSGGESDFLGHACHLGVGWSGECLCRCVIDKNEEKNSCSRHLLSESTKHR